MAKLILDTDIGVDDCIALRYAILTQEVLGVTCTYGNVAVGQAVKNCKFTLKNYNKDIPVFKGASRPLARNPLPLEAHIHGSDGLGQYYENNMTADAPDAIQFIIEQAKKYPGELVIATIGPLTNLALALNLCPELPTLVKKVVCMGGAFGTNGNGGNMTHFSEFNIYNDPEACDIVFASKLPLVIVPLDVTHKVLLSAEQIASTNDDFLKNVTAFYLNFYQNHDKFAGMAVHDALTISYLLFPDKFTTKKTRLAVSTSGYTDGQTIYPITTYEVPNDKFAGRIEHEVCLDVEAEFIRNALLKTLTI